MSRRGRTVVAGRTVWPFSMRWSGWSDLAAPGGMPVSLKHGGWPVLMNHGGRPDSVGEGSWPGE